MQALGTQPVEAVLTSMQPKLKRRAQLGAERQDCVVVCVRSQNELWVRCKECQEDVQDEAQLFFGKTNDE